MSEDVPLCPSARCSEGAVILGLIDGNGKLNMVRPPLPVTPDFIAISNEGKRPDSRFRFASQCQPDLCTRWVGGKCVIARLAVAAERSTLESGASLQECMIRTSCRWYQQEGESACRACIRVITSNDLRTLSDGQL
jgi:hypothetical protein